MRSTDKTTGGVQFGFAALTMLCTLGATEAPAHLQLIKSYPEEGQEIAAPVDSVRLWFNEELEAVVSRVTLEGPMGEVEVGKAEPTDTRKSFRVRVAGPLGAGDYRVVWRAAGPDGHAVRGRFTFTVLSSYR